MIGRLVARQRSIHSWTLYSASETHSLPSACQKTTAKVKNSIFKGVRLHVHAEWLLVSGLVFEWKLQLSLSWWDGVWRSRSSFVALSRAGIVGVASPEHRHVTAFVLIQLHVFAYAGSKHVYEVTIISSSSWLFSCFHIKESLKVWFLERRH